MRVISFYHFLECTLKDTLIVAFCHEHPNRDEEHLDLFILEFPRGFDKLY